MNAQIPAAPARVSSATPQNETIASDHETLRRRVEILSAVGFAANAFLQSSDWRDSIDSALERLGTSLRASRAYFFELHLADDGIELVSQRAEWTADGIVPQIDNPNLHDMPWIDAGLDRWSQQMRERKPVYGAIEDFPASECEALQSGQIQSLIAVPVFVQHQLRGYLGFDDCELPRECSFELDALSAAATSLGAAFERQQLDNQLRLIQKMEAVGVLATGVAHDFNNMLQAISAFTSIAKLKIDEQDEAQHDLDHVLAATDCAHRLTQQLLGFSKEKKSQPNTDRNERCQSGTQFEICSPQVKDASVGSPSLEKTPSGTETILIVDDEPLVLNCLTTMIEAMGYRVIAAHNGKQALEVYRGRSDEIDLVLTDTVMPEMNGFVFRRAVLKINGDAKVILTSGHTPDLTSVNIFNRDSLVMLRKPFSQSMLATSIRGVLDSVA